MCISGTNDEEYIWYLYGRYKGKLWWSLGYIVYYLVRTFTSFSFSCLFIFLAITLFIFSLCSFLVLFLSYLLYVSLSHSLFLLFLFLNTYIHISNLGYIHILSQCPAVILVVILHQQLIEILGRIITFFSLVQEYLIVPGPCLKYTLTTDQWLLNLFRKVRDLLPQYFNGLKANLYNPQFQNVLKQQFDVQISTSNDNSVFFEFRP